MVGVAASGKGVGAESAPPCSTANFRASAKVGGFSLGVAGLIRAFLRVLRQDRQGHLFDGLKDASGLRFQPYASTRVMPWR